MGSSALKLPFFIEKDLLKYVYTHIFSILSFLIVSFFAPIVIIDVINDSVAYYESTFEVENIEQFEHELLANKDFLNEVKSSASKYENINVDKMLRKGDFSYVINESYITITTKIKYYDDFFISSSSSVGSSNVTTLS